MTLDFTAAAISDLRSIRGYTLENWGPQQEQSIWILSGGDLKILSPILKNTASETISFLIARSLRKAGT